MPPSHAPLPLEFPFGSRLPERGGYLEVAPGIRWIRMPLPFALDHINLWLLRDCIDGREGWTLVDCGADTPDTRQAWEQVIVHGLEGLPLLRVVVTHMHPDHIGLAHWLCSRFQAPLWISALDYHVARVGVYDQDGFGGESGVEFYRQHGQSAPEFVAHVRERRRYYPSLVPALPRQFERLSDGQSVAIGADHWDAIDGYGHAPEHIMLHSRARGVLLSGDMVLPSISTNVSVHANEPHADPLGWFLDSLKRYEGLPEDSLVLPSHGRPFRGLHSRLGALQAHHEERLQTLLKALESAGEASAAQVLPVLFQRPLDLHQTTFALGETVAHLHRLCRQGLASRHTDQEGIHRFRARQV